MPSIADRVRETTTTEGTGTVTLGGAVLGFQSFATRYPYGNQEVYYGIVGGAQWEVGIGTYSAGSPSAETLTRDTVLDSSNAGALVNFAAGSKDVFVTIPAYAVGRAHVIADSGASHDIAADEVGSYIRMTSGHDKTVTFRPESVHALPTDGEWHVRNAASSGSPAPGNLTLVAGSGVTLNAPADGTLVLEPGMTVTVKRVAADTFDVFGQTQAA